MAYYETLKATGALAAPRGGQPIGNTWPAWEITTPQYPQPSPYHLAQAGYRRNEIVYACIQKRASAVAEAPLRVYTETEDGGVSSREEEKRHLLRELVRRPNDAMGEVEFWQATQIYLDIAGFSVWEIEFNRLGEPRNLWPLRPDWCSFLRGQGKPLAAVRYQPWGLAPVDVPIERLLVFTEFDPLHPMLKGLARSAVALRAVSVDNAATDFLKLFFENGAVVNGLLKTVQSLTQAEADRIRQNWRQQHGGAQNWTDPAVLGSGVEYQQMQMNFQQMAFEAIDGRDEARICQIFEVPPILVGSKIGLDRATYANYKEARLAFYEETITPRWRWLASEVGEQLLPHFEADVDERGRYAGELVTNFDLSDVRALQEDRDAKWKRGVDGFKAGLVTRDEGRNEAGLDPIDGDTPVFFGNQTAVGDEVEQEKEQQEKAKAEQQAAQVEALRQRNEGARDEQDDEEEQMKAWRKAALAAVGQGVGAPFDAELARCATKAQTRAVFERHWPKLAAPTPGELFVALMRATEAAERLGAA